MSFTLQEQELYQCDPDDQKIARVTRGLTANFHFRTLRKKIVAVFDKTDPRKVRDVLGDHVILVAGPPNSLLIGGTPQKVDDYMKSMLTDCKEGGMMIYPGADGGISGDARPENVKALIEAVKKYGKY